MSREERARGVWSQQQGSAETAGCASLGTGLELEAGYRHSEEWRQFRRLVPVASHSRVAELGTGNGRWLESLAPLVRECTGVDYSPSMIELARARIESAGLANCRLITSSVTADVLDGVYDIIYFSGCLQYLDDADVAKAVRIAVAHVGPLGWIVDRTTISRAARIEGTREQRYSVYRTAEEHIALFQREGLELVARRKSHESLWIPTPLRVRPLLPAVAWALRAAAPWSYRVASRLSALRWRLWPTADERTYSHDFFVFRRSA